MAGKRRNMNLTNELRTAADEIIALELEKKEIGDTIDDRYEALAAKGIDVAAFKVAVKRRKESATQRATRRERDAIADVYSAAMGDLFGKPLDDLTRTRMEEERRRLAEMAQPAGEAAESEPQPDALPGTVAEPITAEQIAAAREEGKTARLAEPPARIVDNPHHSADPRRAAWDEGWCEADGSDGMQIPAAWRRKPEEKPDDNKPGTEGAPPPEGNKPDDKKPPQGGSDGGQG